MSAKRPDQLRGAIDSGKTRDKVAGRDPAAAPLGTDEEAAGTPVPPAAVAQAMRDETSRPAREPRDTDAKPMAFPPTLVVLILMALAVVALIWWLAS